ncbi:MAG: lytic transglycosylase domain-containing protein, partial [Bryobacteraceae bacterium]
VIFLLRALPAQQAQPPAPPAGPPAGQPAVPSPVDARAEMEAATARQRTAAAAFEESLAQQRASVQQQLAQTASGSFFILPPPLTLGATAAAPALLGAFADCDPLPSTQVDTLVGEAAKRQHLEEDVLRGVMRQESAFRPCAVSTKGAMGLMQLMPATADQYGVKHPFDRVENVEAGARLLKDLLSRYGGDLTLALGAYNAGAAKVDAAEGVPRIPETQDYVQKIMSNLPAKQQ